MNPTDARHLHREDASCKHGMPPGCCAVCIETRYQKRIAGERRLAQAAGMTLNEWYADVTAPDPGLEGEV